MHFGAQTALVDWPQRGGTTGYLQAQQGRTLQRLLLPELRCVELRIAASSEEELDAHSKTPLLAGSVKQLSTLGITRERDKTRRVAGAPCHRSAATGSAHLGEVLAQHHHQHDRDGERYEDPVSDFAVQNQVHHFCRAVRSKCWYICPLRAPDTSRITARSPCNAPNCILAILFNMRCLAQISSAKQHPQPGSCINIYTSISCVTVAY